MRPVSHDAWTDPVPDVREGTSDDRSRFRSADPDLDRFFLRFAGQNQFRHHIGVTYVAVAGGTLLGYLTVSASSLRSAEIPDRVRSSLPGYPIPVLRVARLAVDEHAKACGDGSTLLRFALGLAREMARRFGCAGVVVDAKVGAVAFYVRFGFAPLAGVRGALGERPAPVPLFLPVDMAPTASDA